MRKAILGISAYYHDSAAALVIDGYIAAAAQEERFTRVKHDASFPANAIQYVLDESGLDYDSLQAVVFYDKPYLKFERLLETYHAFSPSGLSSFLSAIPVWIKEKLFMKKMLRQELQKFGTRKLPLLFPEHHLSHAASAFYPSPFKRAAILTIDGVGEWATTTIGYGDGKEIRIIEELHFPHSLGLLYSAFTYYTGFVVNSGEYKLMGLAPYGNPDSEAVHAIKRKILEELTDIREDGSLLLNMKYFRFATGLQMTDDARWTRLFGFPPRKPEDEITQPYMDMALAIQQVTEDVVLQLARKAKELTGCDFLVMAGGVALNSVANGKLLDSGLFKDIWIQPAAGDAGGSVGAALLGWHLWLGQERTVNQTGDGMHGALLGPGIENEDVQKLIKRYQAPAAFFEDPENLAVQTAKLIAEGNVIGWVQGRMEFGPRALGNRSILGDARNPEMQKKMNLKVKFREGFRPFAPSVLMEDASEYFAIDRPSPYMLFVIPVKDNHRNPLPDAYDRWPLYDRLYFRRSDLPAITHIDYSARIQTVDRDTNPAYWNLLDQFKKLTGYGVIINTSFNVRGEPIVCTPEDAYRCFMRSGMDYLVMGPYLFEKTAQPDWENTQKWATVFARD